MKLRIKGDSIRLRLTQNDVRQLHETGSASEVMHVAPGAMLTYGLRAADGSQLRAVWQDTVLTVLVPRDWIGPWATGEGVGFEGQQDTGGGQALAILVEKDFACLHKRPDDADAFPNPHAGTV